MEEPEVGGDDAAVEEGTGAAVEKTVDQIEAEAAQLFAELQQKTAESEGVAGEPLEGRRVYKCVCSVVCAAISHVCVCSDTCVWR